ncbi:Uncharacterized protein Adt_30401 [Abeliophyllum distichum]|uniref:DUF674 domain-containing protein n=1 Tax=Abeliophyllum distichum TaxID=126358 RepID=A0ABD1RB70_9LAMI
MAESKVSLKLLIDTKSKRVLFAEAGKDFVDFIFHILAMPLATAIRLLGKQEMVGCLGKLYESVENLNDTYILQGKKKEIFLKPKALNPIASVPLSMLTDKPTHKIYYSCNHCNQESNVGHFKPFGSSSNTPSSLFGSSSCTSAGFSFGGSSNTSPGWYGGSSNTSGGFSFGSSPLFCSSPSTLASGYSNNPTSSPISSRQYSFSDHPNTPCPECSKIMTRILTYVAPPPNKDRSNEGGFVKDVTYMVMDDLVVKPLSTISSMTLLNEYNVKELAALQEKVVDLGMDEALMLLKACLHSSNVLTTVFLNGED